MAGKRHDGPRREDIRMCGVRKTGSRSCENHVSGFWDEDCGLEFKFDG